MKFTVKSWTLGPATSSLILSIIFNTFAIALLYHFLTSFYRSGWEVFGATVRFAVGIPGAFCFIGILRERKVVKKEFFPLNEGLGASHVLELANKLQDRLSALNCQKKWAFYLTFVTAICLLIIDLLIVILLP